MQPEAGAVVRDVPPLPVSFTDLFDGIGTFDINFSCAAQDLSGRQVVIAGFLTQPHGGQSGTLLVNEPGACPDCSPVPVPAITVSGLRVQPREGDDSVCRIRGRLDYGFRLDEGVASFLRIEQAVLVSDEV
jgi:hypothetical protein